jgi:hypothetical protein
VLFVHNTSRVENEPHGDLMSEMGFGGWPALVFLDAEGDKLGQPQGRSVEAFQSTLDRIEKVQKLREKEDRTPAEDATLLFERLDLGQLSLEEAKAEREKLGDEVDKEQKAEIDNAIVLLEVQTVMQRHRREPQKAGAEFAKMLEEGKTPTGEASANFWYVLAQHAKSERDVQLFEKALSNFESAVGDTPRGKQFAERLRQELEEMKKGG